MKKIIWVIVWIGIAGYAYQSYVDKEARKEAKRVKNEQNIQVTKLAVAQMVEKTQAANGWEPMLTNGKKYRFDPILTIELERAWLQPDRPILYVGNIKDVSTHDATRYKVNFERNLYGRLSYRFDTEMRLSLIADKARIDALLKSQPRLVKKYYTNNGVAVVARIDTITSSEILGQEGEVIDIKTGHGELIDIVYTGNVKL